jgi:hypothetical protein
LGVRSRCAPTRSRQAVRSSRGIRRCGSRLCGEAGSKGAKIRRLRIGRCLVNARTSFEQTNHMDKASAVDCGKNDNHRRVCGFGFGGLQSTPPAPCDNISPSSQSPR